MIGLAMGCSIEQIETTQPTRSGFKTSALALQPTQVEKQASRVYESRHTIHDTARSGDIEVGSLDQDILARARAPWLYVADSRPFISESAEVRSIDGDTGMEFIYRLEQVPNDNPKVPKFAFGPMRVEDKIRDWAKSGGHESVEVVIRVKGLGAYDVPPPPDRGLLTAQETSIARNTRDQALRDRAVRGQSLANPLLTWTGSVGGSLKKPSNIHGYLLVNLPKSALSALLLRDDVLSVHSNGEMHDNACLTNCTQGGTNVWNLGESYTPERLDIQRFWSAGYTGERANGSFHNWNDINVAVMEKKSEASWEDEGVFFYDGSPGSASRIKKKRKCSSNLCSYTSNFADSEPDGSTNFHPTMVASIVASDFGDYQAYNYQAADLCWSGAGTHCTDWKDRATGAAPEVSLQMWAGATATINLDNAILDSIASSSQRPDIINLSTSLREPNRCNENSGYTFETAIESAYQDGVFIVNGPDNVGSISPNGACNLDSPGDIPTSFTVNGVATKSTGCQNSYQNCARHSSSASAVGGVDLLIGSTTYSRAMSAIDLQAPGEYAFWAWGTGLSGGIAQGDTSGTSIAAPLVSGAAALVKDWHLAEGQTWINSPGRLHTIMLAMGDRHRGTTQSTTAFDLVHGAGKLKLRPLWSGQNMSPWGRHIRTYTTSSTGTYKYMPFGSPMSSGAVIVKCVMQEHEFMANKSDVSDIYLSVGITTPSGGSCQTGQSVSYSRSDATYDLKHLVAITSADTSLTNKCIEVQVHRGKISSAGQASASIYCYYSGEADDEPN